MQNVQINTTDVPRLKFDSEFNSGFGYNRYTMNLNHNETLRYYQSLSDGYNIGYGVGFIVGGVAVGALGIGIGIGVSGIVNGQILSSKYNEYVN